MRYSNKEDAIPMVKALSKLKGVEIDIETVDLSTLSRDFFDAYRSHSVESRKALGFFNFHRLRKEDPQVTVGCWAFFPDIAVQGGCEVAFGKIMGARDTKSWEGLRYFLYAIGHPSMQDISNAMPVLIDINCEVIDRYNFSQNEHILCSDYLNTSCVFLNEGEKEIGRISSFNENEIFVVSESTGVKHSISFEDRNTLIIDVAENSAILKF